MTERIYTTVDVAKLCKVSLRTVIRWVDEGKLPSFRTPGGHRRVREEDLKQFMSHYKIPFSVGSKSEGKKILIVDQQKKLEDMLRQILRRSSDVYEIAQAKDLYESALKIGLLLPDLVILAGSQKFQDVQRFFKALERVSETKDTKVLLIGSSISGIKKQENQVPEVHMIVNESLTIDNLRPHLLELLESSSPRSSK